MNNIGNLTSVGYHEKKMYFNASENAKILAIFIVAIKILAILLLGLVC